MYDYQCILFAPRLHEICEGHRLLTLRGRGSELQAVSGLKINRQKRRLRKGGIVFRNMEQAADENPWPFFVSGVFRHQGFLNIPLFRA